MNWGWLQAAGRMEWPLTKTGKWGGIKELSKGYFKYEISIKKKKDWPDRHVSGEGWAQDGKARLSAWAWKSQGWRDHLESRDGAQARALGLPAAPTVPWSVHGSISKMCMLKDERFQLVWLVLLTYVIWELNDPFIKLLLGKFRWGSVKMKNALQAVDLCVFLK